MTILFKQVQSKEKPTEIDITSSPNGVYYRRNIKEVEAETESGIVIRYEYQEAFMTFDEWEEYEMTVLSKKLNEEDNSSEFEEYAEKLRTGVEYANGKKYKPIWHKIYSSIIDEFEPKINLYKLAGQDITPFLGIKTYIYDETGKFVNAELMNIKEVIDLWLFLYQKKEEYYGEYKAAKEADKVEAEEE